MKPSFLKSIAIIFTLALAFSPLTISTAQAAVKIGSYVGNWKPSITYAGGDLITYSNKTFLSLVAKNKAKDPIKNPKVWQLLGGVGVTGPQGLPGVQGVAGSKGDTGLQGATGTNGIGGVTGPQGLLGVQGAAGIGSVGTATGDMQWWNGSQWVMIPVGTNNAILKNCNGIPTWLASSAPCPFLIGDTGPAGGIIFYFSDNTGLHGLEAAPAAPADQFFRQWGCQGVAIDGTSAAVGTGLANTNKIVARCAEALTAAKVAQAFTLNGFSDWYLPSKDELSLMYSSIGKGAAQPLTNVGGFADENYWSSSEYNNDLAWNQMFIFGYQNSNDKVNYLKVRPVRSF